MIRSDLLPFHDLLVINPVSPTMVLDLMERRGNCMQKRAHNRQDERSPGQITRVICRVRCLARCTSAADSIRQSTWVVAVPCARDAAVRARKYRDGDECAYKREIEQHPYPAQYAAAGVRALLDTSEKRTDQGVEYSGGENALDGAVRTVYAAPGFDAVDEAVDFVHALREDAERDDGREELKDAGEAEEETIGLAVLEPGGHEACEETGLLALVGDGVVGWTVDGGLVVVRHCWRGCVGVEGYGWGIKFWY